MGWVLDPDREGNEGTGGGYSPDLLIELLRRLSIESTRHVAMIAKKMNIGFTEVVALHHLYDSEGLTVGELGHRMFLTKGAATHLADRLETLGYLTRSSHPTDRRSVILTATTAGNDAALSEMKPFVREAMCQIGNLTPRQREVIGVFLVRVTQAMSPQTSTDEPDAKAT